MFGLQIKVEVFYDLILSFWVCAARHVQNTQNNKFTISLQYLIENVKDEVTFLQADKLPKVLKVISLDIFTISQPKDEVEFLSADKHESFLQGDNITLGVRNQACPEYPK